MNWTLHKAFWSAHHLCAAWDINHARHMVHLAAMLPHEADSRDVFDMLMGCPL